MKLKKLSAAVLASTMALTASPVFAAYSPDAADKPNQDVIPVKLDKEDGVNVFEIDGDTYYLEVEDVKGISKEEEKALDSVTTSKNAAENRMEIIKAAGYDTNEFETTVVLGSGFYELVNDKNNQVVNQLPGGESFTLSFMLGEEATYNYADKDIFVMHFDDSKGAWEVQTAKVDKDGILEFELKSLSPLSFVGALGWEGKYGSRPAVSAPGKYERPPLVIPTNPDDNKVPGTDKPNDVGKPEEPSVGAKPSVTLKDGVDGEVNSYEVDEDTYIIQKVGADKASSKERKALDSVTKGKNQAENRRKILAHLGYDMDECDTTMVLGSGFYQLVNTKNNKVVHELPGGESFTAEFILNNAADFIGKDIYVMHYLEATDSWDVQIVHVNDKGGIEVELNSLSPLAFIGAQGWERNGKRPAMDAPGKVDKTDDDKGGAVETPVQSGTTTTGANALITKTSPNTAA